MKKILAFVIVVFLSGPPCLQAQSSGPPDDPLTQNPDAVSGSALDPSGDQGGGLQDMSPSEANPFDRASSGVTEQLEKSLRELSELREQLAGQKIPLSRKLADLEGSLVEVRLEYQKTARLLDSRTLDVSNLRNEIKSRREENTYLSNLLSEYIRNFESRLNISEVQVYRDLLETAKLAPENTNLSQQDVFLQQAMMVAESLERLHKALNGTRFEGTAVNENGLVKTGTFVLVGPAAVFRSGDGQDVGAIEQRLGSVEPAIVAYADEEDTRAADQTVTESAGLFPLDPTLGNAHKIEMTQETFLEHVKKGGPVMVPIFLLAGAALLTALYKWLVLSFQRVPSRNQIEPLLQAVAKGNQTAARKVAGSIKGPVGKMLAAGVDHLNEPRELIEEVMYELILATRLRLQSLLPFIAITASSAPLLGLLGTVTGIINTFKLITVFGSGDVKTLSGGISEALITTKFGLIVAIPSLLLHAFLSRKARGVIDQMEKAAIAFINQISKTPFRPMKMTGNNPRDPLYETVGSKNAQVR